MKTTLASHGDVAAAIERVAAEIIRDHPDDNPLFVSLLRGAAPFSSQLMLAITRQQPDYHPELDYMMVSTYGDGRTAGAPRIVTDLAPDTALTGRTAIVLDDVLDKGITADFVINYLHSRDIGDVKLAVLVDKQTERVQNVSVDYACLTSGDVWLAGMGMDDAATAREAYRWSDSIYQIDK